MVTPDRVLKQELLPILSLERRDMVTCFAFQSEGVDEPLSLLVHAPYTLRWSAVIYSGLCSSYFYTSSAIQTSAFQL